MDFGAKILGQFCDFMLSFHSGSSKEWSKKKLFYPKVLIWFWCQMSWLDFCISLILLISSIHIFHLTHQNTKINFDFNLLTFLRISTLTLDYSTLKINFEELS